MASTTTVRFCSGNRHWFEDVSDIDIAVLSSRIADFL